MDDNNDSQIPKRKRAGIIRSDAPMSVPGKNKTAKDKITDSASPEDDINSGKARSSAGKTQDFATEQDFAPDGPPLQPDEPVVTQPDAAAAPAKKRKAFASYAMRMIQPLGKRWLLLGSLGLLGAANWLQANSYESSKTVDGIEIMQNDQTAATALYQGVMKLYMTDAKPDPAERKTDTLYYRIINEHSGFASIGHHVPMQNDEGNTLSSEQLSGMDFYKTDVISFSPLSMNIVTANYYGNGFAGKMRWTDIGGRNVGKILGTLKATTSVVNFDQLPAGTVDNSPAMQLLQTYTDNGKSMFVQKIDKDAFYEAVNKQNLKPVTP